MRRFNHWTPHYLWDRLAEIAYRKRHPDDPWLTPQAVYFLDSYLGKSDRGLEFGSGRSTLWFARRVSSLISVEHDAEWHRKVSQRLVEKKVINVTYRFFHEKEEAQDAKTSGYVAVAHHLTENSLDFALVDGIFRDHCALESIRLLRVGGILILDNANWFLPSESISPDSRRVEQRPVSPGWAEFLSLVKDWRCFWTSNGVTDTAIYFKPTDEIPGKSARE